MTVDEMIEVLEAYRDGKAVESNYCHGEFSEWSVWNEHQGFDPANYDYRIAPEPLEVWVNTYSGGQLVTYLCEDRAKKYGDHRCVRVAVRMVEA